jgi:hypothetical protein
MSRLIPYLEIEREAVLCTLWIHRALAPDMIVRFYTIEEAYFFALRFMKRLHDDFDLDTYLDDAILSVPQHITDIACTGKVQLAIYKSHTIHPDHETFSPSGIFVVTPLMAIQYGEDKIPTEHPSIEYINYTELLINRMQHDTTPPPQSSLPPQVSTPPLNPECH